MESLLTGSLAKPTSFSCYPGIAGLRSTSHGARILQCKQRENIEKQLMEPEILHKNLQMSSQNVRISNNIVKSSSLISRKGSDSFLANSALNTSYESESSKSLLKTIQETYDVFYRFVRPYAFVGDISSILTVSLIAVKSLSDFSPMFLTGMFQVMAAVFFMYIYYVGINQVADVEIDKVNKPYLPLASGEYSMKTAWIIISLSAIVSFGISWSVGSLPLFCGLLTLFVFGTIYSVDLPYLRWKKSALLAGVCTLAFRVPTQLTYYWHMQSFVLGRPVVATKPITLALAMTSLFSIVIALFKDIPDIPGDKLHGVKSLAVRLGQKTVFGICIALLQIGYLSSIAVGLTASQNWSKAITVSLFSYISLFTSVLYSLRTEIII
ncbi:OLC1v1008955C1 [Oldenlandia corymbosa var. corymbosa]|uniref:OLC1v1008955C1 n=1 Tax=Oldenlandia corymbosa var. corymbosa TaxID=529605 RepID=A0AAV1DMS2_OLDCO|nr:OLC1v1008955C1 [Oldenlandia corymbosa var. corymbosa]